MLKITIPDIEKFNEETNEFITIKGQTIQLEHSLVSISKWESKWCVPFFDNKREKSIEEIKDYIRCMTLTQNVNPEIYDGLTVDLVNEIIRYIQSPMTATTFSNEQNKPDKEILTSEIIYYDMIALNIPFECQKWHINKLLTLIKVCSIKNTPPKKMSKNALMNRNHALNAQRRAKLKSRG